MTLNSRTAQPSIANGYELNPNKGYFSVVLPLERTNLITNPSFETNTTGYTSQSGAVLVRTTAKQRRGVFSLQVKPGLANDSGIFYTTSPLTLGNVYAFSLDVFIRGGASYIINVTDGINTLVSEVIIGKGYWERFDVTFTATTNGAHRLYLQKNGNSDTTVFYTDGWQLEQCETGNYFATTYIDGDLTGYVVNQVPPAYFWTGTPHGSTSIRSGQTRAGGQVVSMKSLGLLITAMIGLGMTPIQNVSTPFGLLGGALYQRTVLGTRSFTLVGTVMGSSLAQVQRNRRNLIDALKPDLLGVQQPLLLKYQYMNDDGSPNGEELEMSVNYVKGLEGNNDNLNQEKLAIQFVDYHGYQNNTGEVGAQLSFASAVVDNNPLYIVSRSRAGIWSKLDSRPQNPVYALAEGLNGLIYLGGQFNDLGSVGSTKKIGSWNGSTFAALGSGIVGTKVLAIVVGPDGRIYAGGNFTNAGGVAVNNIAVFDPVTNTWAAMGTGCTGGQVSAMCLGPDGNIYVGGQFTAAGGLANTKFIARWNPVTSAWQALGTGGQSTTGISGHAVVAGLDGKIYVGGDNTTTYGGVANTTCLARWNIASGVWESLTTVAPTSDVTALAVALDGSIYIGGTFAQIGGISASRIARYNGASFTPLGSGLNNGVSNIVIDAKGNVLVGGNGFSTAGGLPVFDSFAIWNGTAWTFGSIDINRPLSVSVNSLLVTHTNDLYMGIDDGTGPNRSSPYSGITPITITGEGAVSPKFIFYGSGTLFEIDNFTTGAVIYFNSLTIQANEVVTLDLTPGSISFKSNIRGNLLSYILPGSNLATFNLTPGANSIGVFILDGNASCAAYIKWREQQWGIDGGIRR